MTVATEASVVEQVKAGLIALGFPSKSTIGVMEAGSEQFPVMEEHHLGGGRWDGLRPHIEWITDGRKELQDTPDCGLYVSRYAVSEATYVFELIYPFPYQGKPAALGTVVLWPGADAETVLTAIREAMS